MLPYQTGSKLLDNGRARFAEDMKLTSGLVLNKEDELIENQLE